MARLAWLLQKFRTTLLSAATDDSRRFLRLAAARYIELNLGKAKLVENSGDNAWSSAKANLKQKAKGQDKLLNVGSLLELVEDWRAFLAEKEIKERTAKMHCVGTKGPVVRWAMMHFYQNLKAIRANSMPQHAGRKSLRGGNK